MIKRRRDQSITSYLETQLSTLEMQLLYNQVAQSRRNWLTFWGPQSAEISHTVPRMCNQIKNNCLMHKKYTNQLQRNPKLSRNYGTISVENRTFKKQNIEYKAEPFYWKWIGARLAVPGRIRYSLTDNGCSGAGLMRLEVLSHREQLRSRGGLELGRREKNVTTTVCTEIKCRQLRSGRLRKQTSKSSSEHSVVVIILNGILRV